MKRKYIFMFIMVLIASFVFSYYFNNDVSNAECTKIDQKVDEKINDIIDTYALEKDNREDLFYYNYNYKDFVKFRIESYIKWYEKDDITGTTDYITKVILYDVDELINEQIISFKIDNNDEIIDYTRLIGVEDDIIDPTVNEEYYTNLYTSSCDIQQEK